MCAADRKSAALRPPGHEMEMAPDSPQELFAAAKQPVFLARKQASSDNSALRALGKHISRSKQRVEVAQAAFAVFDVGLDEIARATGLDDPGSRSASFAATNSAAVEYDSRPNRRACSRKASHRRGAAGLPTARCGSSYRCARHAGTPRSCGSNGRPSVQIPEDV